MNDGVVRICIISAIFLSHCALSGYAAISYLSTLRDDVGSGLNRFLILFFAISTGLVLNVAALFLLGMAGWMSTAGVLMSGFFIACLSVLVAWRTTHNRSLALEGWMHLDAIVLLAIFLATCLVSLHAPGVWDDTMYHLPLARTYVEHGAILVNPFLRFPLFPQNGNLIIALGLMLGGDIGAQIFATLPLFVMAVGLLGASQWFSGGRLLGILSAISLFALSPVRSTLGYAYIDNSLALFCWGAALALAVWAHQLDTGKSSTWLVVAGILTGGAAGTKYFGLVFGSLLVAQVIFASRAWRDAALFAGVSLMFGVWWYARSFNISGDPIHPAGGNIFGFYLWDAADLLAQKQEQASFGVRPRSLDILGALYLAKAVPMMVALSSLLLRNLPTGVRCLRLVFIGYLAFWFFVTQVDRYLAPIYAIGVFLAWFSVGQAEWLTQLKGVRQWRGARAVGTLMIVGALGSILSSLYSERQSSDSQWLATLERRPGYQLYSSANTLIPAYGDHIVQVGFENGVYFFHGTVIGDWFGPGRYRQMLKCDASGCGVIDPVQMIEIMDRLGAKMLMVSTARYSNFDPRVYEPYFDTLAVASDGLLMAIKEPRTSAAGLLRR